MGCDDPERLGWARIAEFLDRDGVCGFRLIPSSNADKLQSHLKAQGFRFDRWDVFLADRRSALAASEAILSHGLPDEFRELERPADPQGRDMARIQTLMNDAGVMPFSGSMLTGGVGPASTVTIGEKDGTVVAVAHGYLPHNSFSPYHRYAWGGLVAVAEAQRGKGLQLCQRAYDCQRIPRSQRVPRLRAYLTDELAIPPNGGGGRAEARI